jgi:hypothetical protein
MIWKTLIAFMIPSAACACGATDEEIRAMYGVIGFGTFAGLALVVAIVMAVKTLRKTKP